MVCDGIIRTGAIVLPNLGGFLTSKYVRKNMVWYDTLNKSPYNPPKCVFAPAWTVLYSSIGYSSYLVWKHGGGCSGPARLPLMVYGGHLMLNLAWTPLFFGMHKLKLSLYEIIAVDVTSVLTAYLFYQVKPLAGWLFVPYFGWLCLATVLTYHVATNNPDGNESATITEIKDE